MYETKVTVRMYHTDTAQVIFFANLFYLCEDIIEDVFTKINLPITKSLDMKNLDYPLCYVVHCDADFREHIRLGDQLKVKLTCNKVGQTSFSFRYLFYKNQTLAAQATTTHVCVSKINHQKVVLPQNIKQQLLLLV